MAAVDEQERERDLPDRTRPWANRRPVPTTVPSSPASWIVRRKIGSVSILPTSAIDQIGLVMLPAGLVLLAPPMVVEREEDPTLGLRRCAEVDRGLAAVAADLEERAGHGHGLGRVEQGQALVGRHEAAGGFGVGEQLGVDRHVSRTRRRPRSGCAT